MSAGSGASASSEDGAPFSALIQARSVADLAASGGDGVRARRGARRRLGGLLEAGRCGPLRDGGGVRRRGAARSRDRPTAPAVTHGAAGRGRQARGRITGSRASGRRGRPIRCRAWRAGSAHRLETARSRPPIPARRGRRRCSGGLRRLIRRRPLRGWRRPCAGRSPAGPAKPAGETAGAQARRCAPSRSARSGPRRLARPAIGAGRGLSRRSRSASSAASWIGPSFRASAVRRSASAAGADQTSSPPSSGPAPGGAFERLPPSSAPSKTMRGATPAVEGREIAIDHHDRPSLPHRAGCARR